MRTASTSTTTSLRKILATVIALGTLYLAAPAAGQVIQWSGPFLGLGGGTLTGALLVADGASNAPSVAFASSTQNGLYKQAANAMGFANGGSLQFLMTGGQFGVINTNGSIAVGGNPDLVWLNTIPVLTTGWGSGATITGHGEYFTITIGTTPASPTTLTLSSNAPHGWKCDLVNETTAANTARETSHTVATAVHTWAAGPTAADVIVGSCGGF